MLSDSPSSAELKPAAVIDVPADGDTCARPPLERVRQALSSLGPGQVLEVRTHVREHTLTVTVWAQRMGFQIVGREEQGREARLLIYNPALLESR